MQKSEAARIVEGLMQSGMQRAEIARLLGVPSFTIRDIALGKQTGAKHLQALRGMAKYTPSPVATPEQSVQNTPAQSAVPVAADKPEPHAATALVDAIEAPKDERTAGDKLKQGIKDAILGKGAGPLIAAPTNRKASKAADPDELVQQLVPTLALLVVVMSQVATPPRYVAVDPTHQEAAAMLTPLVRIMTRQMDAAGKLTETQMDLLQCLLAMGVYGQRAWTTYRDIRAKDAASGTTDSERRGAGRDSAAAATHAIAGGPQPTPVAGPAPAPAAPRLQPTQPSNSGAGANGAGQADPFTAVYAADALGRRKLGIN